MSGIELEPMDQSTLEYSRAFSGVHSGSDMKSLLGSTLKYFKSQLPEPINKTANINSFHLLPSLEIAVGLGQEGNMIYVDLSTNKVTFKRVCTGDIDSMVVHPEGQIAFISFKESLHIVALPRLKLIKELVKCDARALEYNPKGFLVAVDCDDQIHKWAWDGTNLVPEDLNIKPESVNTVVLSRAGDLILVHTGEELILYSIDGEILQRCEQKNQCKIQISQSSAKIAIVEKESNKSSKKGDYSRISTLDCKDFENRSKITPHDSYYEITAITFARNDDLLIYGLDTGIMKIWETKHHKREIKIHVHNDRINDIWVDEVKKCLYSVGSDSSFLKTPLPLFREEYMKKIDFVDFVVPIPRTNEIVMIVNDEKQIKQVDCCSFKGPTVSIPDEKSITALKYSESRKKFFLATDDESEEIFTIMTYSLETKKLELLTSKIDDMINLFEFNENESLLFISGYSPYIKVYKIYTDEMVNVLKGHIEDVSAQIYINRQEKLISGGDDSKIMIWNDVLAEHEPTVLEGHKGGITFLVKNADETILVSSSDEYELFIWSLFNYKIIKKVNVHTTYISNLRIDPTGAILYSMDDEMNFYVWSLETFNRIYSEKIREFEYFDFVADGEKMLFRSNSKVKTVSNPFRDKTLSIVGLKEKNSFMRYIVAFLERKTIPPFDPKMEAGVIMPFMITPMHIFTFLNMPAYLEKSLASGSSIIFISNEENPLSIAINRQFKLCIDNFIKYFTQRVLEEPSMLTCLRRNMLFKLNSYGQPSLVKLYNIFMRKSTDLTLPQFLDSSVDTPAYNLSVSIHTTNTYQNLEQEEDDLKPVVFYESLIKLNYERGSPSSLEFLRSMLDSPNPAIFNTLFVQMYLQYKWAQIKWIMYAQGIVYILYLISLLVYLLFFYLEPDAPKKLYLISTFTLNLLLLLYEFIQLYKDFKNYIMSVWNYIDLARSVLVIVYTVCIWVEIPEEREKFMLLVLVSLSFVRGISYFRLLKITRYMVNLVSEVIKDMLSFFIMLAYTTMAFAFLFYLLLDADKNIFTSLLDSYLINIGEYSVDTFGALEWVLFVFASLINPIIMLNLLISIMGDTFGRVEENKEIADNKELAEMILEVEGLYSKNTEEGTEKYLQICDEDEGDEEDTSVESKVKKLRKSFKEFQNKNQESLDNILKIVNAIANKTEAKVGDLNKDEDSDDIYSESYDDMDDGMNDFFDEFGDEEEKEEINEDEPPDDEMGDVKPRGEDEEDNFAMGDDDEGPGEDDEGPGEDDEDPGEDDEGPGEDDEDD